MPTQISEYHKPKNCLKGKELSLHKCKLTQYLWMVKKKGALKKIVKSLDCEKRVGAMT